MRRLALLVVLSCAPSSASPAFAAPLRCGDVLRANTRLSSDLDCAQTALRAGADGITIDLGRHVLSSSGGYPFGEAGVDTAGHDGVRVVGGRILGFDCGVRLTGRRNAVRGTTIRRVETGVCIRGSRNAVARATIERAFTGVTIERGTDVTVQGSRIDVDWTSVGAWGVLGGDPAGARTVVSGNDLRGGVSLPFAVGAQVLSNRVRVPSSGGVAVQLAHGDATTRVARNAVDGGFVGIALDNLVRESAGGGVRVTGNRVTGSSIGIGVTAFFDGYSAPSAPGDEVVGNVVQDTDTGIVVQGAVDTLVADNLVGSRRPSGGFGANGTGVDVSFGSTDVRLLHNRLHGNDGDGVIVRQATLGTVLRGNVASRNRGDGFDVRSPESLLARNTALGNRGWGILAVPEVAGSGNRAARNLLGQCTPAALC